MTLISGYTNLVAPIGVNRIITESAADMFHAVKKRADDQDIIIKAAAVADYTPVSTSEQKIKKQDGSLTLDLTRTADILAWLGEHKRKGQFLCGFSMETENLLENSKKKLQKKNADMIVANSLRAEGSGFGTDTNAVTLISKDAIRELPLMSKEEAAFEILNEIQKRIS